MANITDVQALPIKSRFSSPVGLGSYLLLLFYKHVVSSILFYTFHLFLDEALFLDTEERIWVSCDKTKATWIRTRIILTKMYKDCLTFKIINEYKYEYRDKLLITHTCVILIITEWIRIKCIKMYNNKWILKPMSWRNKKKYISGVFSQCNG